MSETLLIEKLVYGGFGMGKVKGKVIFVPFALPGDELEIEIKKERKSHCFAEIKKVVTHSDSFIEPDCPYFYQCGGCSFRHMDYGEELRWKKLVFEELLGSLSPGSIHLQGPSVTKFYRNRMDFQVSGRGEIGFFKKESHRLIQIDFCPLAEKTINRFLKKIIDSKILKKEVAPERLSLMNSGKQVFVLLSFPRGKKNKNHEKRVLETAKAFMKLKECAGVEIERKSRDVPFDKAVSRRLNFFNSETCDVSLQSFCQPNLAVNRKMLSSYFEEFKNSDNILDLYAGSGNFSVPASIQGKKVVAVEINRFSIFDLERIKKKRELKNLEIVPSSVLAFLKKGVKEKWDTVVMDPPREGMKKETVYLAEGGFKKIIYVSCNPPSFVRDAKILVENGFTLKRSYVFDMFPRTCHFESLNVFEK